MSQKKNTESGWTPHWPSKTLNKLTRIGWLGRQWQWFYLLKDCALLNEPKGKLPNSDAVLFQAAKVEPAHRRGKKNFRRLWEAVKAEFKVDGQWLILPETAKEIEKTKEFSKKQSERANQRWAKEREKKTGGRVEWNGVLWFPSELQEQLRLLTKEADKLKGGIEGSRNADLRESGKAALRALRDRIDSVKRVLALSSPTSSHNVCPVPSNAPSARIPEKSGSPAMEKPTDLESVPPSQFSDKGLAGELARVAEEIAAIRKPAAGHEHIYFDSAGIRPAFEIRVGVLEARERELNAEKWEREKLHGLNGAALKKKSSKTKRSSKTSAVPVPSANTTTSPGAANSLSGSP